MLRPTVEQSRDPLNVQALPPTAGMELDYRTAPLPLRKAVVQTASLVFFMSMAVFAVTLVARILDLAMSAHTVWNALVFFALHKFFTYPLSPTSTVSSSLVPAFSRVLTFAFEILVVSVLIAAWEFFSGQKISTEFMLAVLTLVCFVEGVYFFARGEQQRGLFTASAGLVVACLLLFGRSVLLSPVAPLVCFMLGVACCVWLSDGLTAHYVAWTNANPRLTRATRIRWRRLWDERFRHAREISRNPALLFSAGRTGNETTRTYIGGYAVVGFSLLAAMAVATFLWPDALAGFAAVIATTFVLLFLAIGWNGQGLSSSRRRLGRKAFWQAVLLWFSYNAHDTRAAGVFRSPWGSRRRRLGLTAFTLFFLSCGMLTAASYFPIGILVSGPRPWIDLAARAHPVDELFQNFQQPLEARFFAAFNSLSPREQEQWKKLLPAQQQPFMERVLEERERQASETLRLTVEQSLIRTPETWIALALRGIVFGESFYIWSLLPSLLLCAIAPLGLLLIVVYAIGGRTMLAYCESLEADDATEADQNASYWDAYTNRLRTSPHRATTGVRERDHLWFGTSVESDYPVLIHRDILKEHVHILGDSGSGKTSLALAPLITQLLRVEDRVDENPLQLQPSLLVLDLKGDDTLFHAARIEAERADIPFRFFTNDRYKSTHIFNPFLQSHMRTMTNNQRVQVLMQALGLEHGEGFGASYFSSVNENVFRKLVAKWDDINSFSRLAEKFRTDGMLRSAGVSKDEQKDAGHLFGVVDSIASLVPLNATPGDSNVPSSVLDHAIDMQDLLSRRQVVYFYLRAVTETVAVRVVAKLALYSLLTAAAERPPTHKRPALIVIDEFQQIVARNLEVILRQARSMGVGVILANQNITDLKTADADLVPTVEANTRLKQVFSASALSQMEQLVKVSGEAMYELASQSLPVLSREHWNMTGASAPTLAGDMAEIGVSEEIGPRFRSNDIAAMSDDPMRSVVHVGRGSGYTQFKGLSFMVTSGHHITRAEYERRLSDEKWPAKSAMTLVADELQPAKPPSPPAKAPQIRPSPSVSPGEGEGRTEFETQLISFMSTAKQPVGKPRPSKSNNKPKAPEEEK